MNNRTLLGFILVAVLCSFCSGFVINGWRYETKLSELRTEYATQARDAYEQNQRAVEAQQKVNRDNTEIYQARLQQLESQVVALDSSNTAARSTIDGLRREASGLRARLSGVSTEAVSEYAVACSRAVAEISGALVEEQLAHQETSRRADSYYSAWELLDTSWPGQSH